MDVARTHSYRLQRQAAPERCDTSSRGTPPLTCCVTPELVPTRHQLINPYQRGDWAASSSPLQQVSLVERIQDGMGRASRHPLSHADPGRMQLCAGKTRRQTFLLPLMSWRASPEATCSIQQPLRQLVAGALSPWGHTESLTQGGDGRGMSKQASESDQYAPREARLPRLSSPLPLARAVNNSIVPADKCHRLRPLRLKRRPVRIRRQEMKAHGSRQTMHAPRQDKFAPPRFALAFTNYRWKTTFGFIPPIDLSWFYREHRLNLDVGALNLSRETCRNEKDHDPDRKLSPLGLWYRV